MSKGPKGGRPPGRLGKGGIGPGPGYKGGSVGKGTKHKGSGGGGGKKGDCCPMVAAVRSVKRGQFRLARRYAGMSVRLIAARVA